jgi:hypothetical protein
MYDVLSRLYFFMGVQSKVASAQIKDILVDLFVGSRKKQLISSTIILIILFLLHVRNKNSKDELKIKLP